MFLGLRESWDNANSVTISLLKVIPEHYLSVKPSYGGRSVGAQFAHINNVRAQWLEAIGGGLAGGLIRLQKDDYTYKTKISEALLISADRIGELIDKSIRGDMKVKGYPKGINSFLFYLVSHEAHHRAQIITTLKAAHLGLDPKFLFGLWDKF
ncbi:MAG: DinB family protein [Ignavibacteriales bacterium]|jgi:DinB family.|nr:MAG: DinB family protein [Ignavibacteriaceae bacterium]MBW7873159.1 DinB family protein [Ignavibacteria bacterium]MCZ2142801.1 DinB family protein [Ignavibacteriales bacterium]OQY79764.1 MAG: hypothetical protein B6D45_00310 [Ignavibacteriales bacterium UTCHB3]MBV6443895.1 hypothetical protein [Ignavibacteriaceae bacterium]